MAWRGRFSAPDTRGEGGDDVGDAGLGGDEGDTLPGITDGDFPAGAERLAGVGACSPSGSGYNNDFTLILDVLNLHLRICVFAVRANLCPVLMQSANLQGYLVTFSFPFALFCACFP